MTGVSSPVSNGFVASLAKPGGNITGIAIVPEEVQGKLIEILHEIVPKARRIRHRAQRQQPESRSRCGARPKAPVPRWASMRCGLGSARRRSSAPPSIRSSPRERRRSSVAADPVFLNERVKLQALMQTTRLPVAYSLRQHVLEGGLLSYSSTGRALFRYSAKYAHRILLGASPPTCRSSSRPSSSWSST
jgi:putative ABC transport system substrate-binding protein